MQQQSYENFHGLSAELKAEFLSSFRELIEELEQCFSILNKAYEEEVIHQLFRSVHSLKGNCHLVFLDDFADVCHLLEDIAAQIRKGDARYSPAQGEFFTYAFVRLEQLLADLTQGNEPSENALRVLEKGISKLLAVPAEQRELMAQELLEHFSGVLSAGRDLSDQVLNKLDTPQAGEPVPETQFDALAFMSEIAGMVQAKSIQQQGDRAKLREICLRLNQIQGEPVLEAQLEAALHFQNLGSRFVTSPIFDLSTDAPEWARHKVKQQLEIAANFLRLNAEWEEAVAIIMDSFERVDGQGIFGKHGAEIHRGAMILSLVRFYQQKFHQSKDGRTERVSVAKALSQLSEEKGKRFSPEIIEGFVQLIREEFSTVVL